VIREFVIAMILLQTSFTIVNATGIFPYASRSSWIDHQKIVDMMNDVNKRFSNATNIFDYLGSAAFALITGLEILLRFTASVFLGFPDFLRAFLIPDQIAIPIGYAVDALLLLGVGYLLIRRA